MGFIVKGTLKVNNVLVVPAENVVVCNPPSGKCKITNIYIDPKTQKVVIKYEDVPK